MRQSILACIDSTRTLRARVSALRGIARRDMEHAATQNTVIALQLALSHLEQVEGFLATVIEGEPEPPRCRLCNTPGSHPGESIYNPVRVTEKAPGIFEALCDDCARHRVGEAEAADTPREPSKPGEFDDQL